MPRSCMGQCKCNSRGWSWAVFGDVWQTRACATPSCAPLTLSLAFVTCMRMHAQAGACVCACGHATGHGAVWTQWTRLPMHPTHTPLQRLQQPRDHWPGSPARCVCQQVQMAMHFSHRQEVQVAPHGHHVAAQTGTVQKAHGHMHACMHHGLAWLRRTSNDPTRTLRMTHLQPVCALPAPFGSHRAQQQHPHTCHPLCPGARTWPRQGHTRTSLRPAVAESGLAGWRPSHWRRARRLSTCPRYTDARGRRRCCQLRASPTCAREAATRMCTHGDTHPAGPDRVAAHVLAGGRRRRDVSACQRPELVPGAAALHQVRRQPCCRVSLPGQPACLALLPAVDACPPCVAPPPRLQGHLDRDHGYLPLVPVHRLRWNIHVVPLAARGGVAHARWGRWVGGRPSVQRSMHFGGGRGEWRAPVGDPVCMSAKGKDAGRRAVPP